MRAKSVDVFIIILILLYTLLVVVYLAIDDEIEGSKSAEMALQITELCFLFVFCIEITLNLVGFGCLFIKDWWNIADITVILLAIVFVILDMILDDSSLSGLFRLRGLFRLLRVGILIRKFDSLRKKSQARKRLKNKDIYHVASPAEIVNEILWDIRDMVENDDKMIEDLNYCIKMVSSGKLYEANIDDNIEEGDENRREAISFFKNIQGNTNTNKKDDEAVEKEIQSKIKTIDIDEKLNLNSQTKTMLNKADSLSFNIFDFKDLVEEKELYVLTSYLLNKHDLFRAMKMDPEVFFSFIVRIQDYYNHSFIEYHNKTHGADVCQTSYFFLEGCDLRNICRLSDNEFGAMLIASAWHDFEHFGFNNPFLIESRLPWAIEYNDQSPLENHHIASTFGVMQKQEYNILKNLSTEEYKTCRKMMIDLVLATDAARHFTDLAKFKSRVGAEDFAPSGEDKQPVLNMSIHLSDISNPAKPFNLALIWTGLLYDEFFKQGDREVEQGRNPSFLMDRNTTNIAGCSIGFINMLVTPAYEELVKVIPDASIWLDNINTNKDKWEEQKSEFAKRMESNNNYIPESRGVILDPKDVMKSSVNLMPSPKGEHWGMGKGFNEEHTMQVAPM